MSKELKDGEYQASLLDSDNQMLSYGKARFYAKEGHGVFWPQNQPDEDSLLKKAATVQTSEGHALSIRKIEKCPAQWPPVAHYDFEFDVLA